MMDEGMENVPSTCDAATNASITAFENRDENSFDDRRNINVLSPFTSSSTLTFDSEEMIYPEESSQPPTNTLTSFSNDATRQWLAEMKKYSCQKGFTELPPVSTNTTDENEIRIRLKSIEERSNILNMYRMGALERIAAMFSKVPEEVIRHLGNGVDADALIELYQLEKNIQRKAQKANETRTALESHLHRLQMHHRHPKKKPVKCTSVVAGEIPKQGSAFLTPDYDSSSITPPKPISAQKIKTKADVACTGVETTSSTISTTAQIKNSTVGYTSVVKSKFEFKVPILYGKSLKHPYIHFRTKDEQINDEKGIKVPSHPVGAPLKRGNDAADTNTNDRISELAQSVLTNHPLSMSSATKKCPSSLGLKMRTHLNDKCFEPNFNLKHHLQEKEFIMEDEDDFYISNIEYPEINLNKNKNVDTHEKYSASTTLSLDYPAASYAPFLCKHQPNNEEGLLPRNSGIYEQNVALTDKTFLLDVLRKRFGLQSYRPYQLEAIIEALRGCDVFVLLPTGGGKSICFQVPALVQNGVTIVFSPLKSLITDQVHHLKELNLPVAALSGNNDIKELQNVYDDLETGNPTIRLIYITPEMIFRNSSLQQKLRRLHSQGKLCRFVVDEAHCVAQWGRDFRPHYNKLGELRETLFKGVPFMCLTATASPPVREYVLKQLKISNPKWFLSSSNRPNLKYVVMPKKSNAVHSIIDAISKDYPNQTGIIYCLTIKDCEYVAEQGKSSNISIDAYHGNLTDNERSEVQRKWSSGVIKVVAATVAFGMGIDKSDVRFVIHHSLAKSLESFYQESGRAGRDGKPAVSIVYYSSADVFRARSMITGIANSNASDATKARELESLQHMESYCENDTDCRRSIQMQYFGEIINSEQHNCKTLSSGQQNLICDNCSNLQPIIKTNVTQEAKCLVDIVQQITSEDYGGQCQKSNSSELDKFGRAAINNISADKSSVTQVIGIFRGSFAKDIKDAGHTKIKHHGIGKSWPKTLVRRLLDKLLHRNILEEKLVFFNELDSTRCPKSFLVLGKKYSTVYSPDFMLEIAERVKSSAHGQSAKLTNRNQAQSIRSINFHSSSASERRNLCNAGYGKKSICGPSTTCKNTLPRPTSKKHWTYWKDQKQPSSKKRKSDKPNLRAMRLSDRNEILELIRLQRQRRLEAENMQQPNEEDEDGEQYE